MSGKTRWFRVGRALCVLLAGCGGPAAADARPRGALWDVVHRLCVPDKAILGLAAPCTMVDRARGVAVVKDAGATGYLLVPTRRISGVEDPRLQRPDAPNYWLAAWDLRRYVARRARRPLDRDAFAMAVNAVAGRTQDQLHIHVDCVRADVRDALSRERARLGPEWTSVSLLGHGYRVRSLTESELAARDPFKLVAESDPAAASAMGEQTIALAGATLSGGGPGFYLLAARASPENRGHAEELLDHGCAGAAVARHRAP